MTDKLTGNEIGLACPDITEREIEAVISVMRTQHLSLGPKIGEFEDKFCELCQTKYAVACNSGTSALHLVLAAMGVGPGDEVITSPFSFVASASCAAFVGAKPVFADIDPDTWCIAPDKLEAAITPRSKVVIPVDVFGITPDMDAINTVARRHGLRVLEDSCEAAGAQYNGKPAGSLGDAGVFGFYPNKQMTTGEGGMVVTDSEEIADLCRSMRNQGRGKGSTWLEHERMGYNFRLSDINCAIGCVQVDRLPEILKRRSEVAKLYDNLLATEHRLTQQTVTKGCEKSWFVYVVRLNDDYGEADRNRIMAGLRSEGIACSNYFSPIHLQPYFRRDFGCKKGDFPECERLSERTIALPFHAFLSETDVERVVSTLQSLL